MNQTTQDFGIQPYGWRHWKDVSFDSRRRSAELAKQRLELVNGSRRVINYAPTVPSCFEYQVPIKNLAASLVGLKIMVFSDLHLASRLPEQFNKLAQLRSLAVGRRPDLILCAGDLFDCDEPYFPRPLKDILSGLSTTAPCIIVSGDHDRSRNGASKHLLSRFKFIQEYLGWKIADNNNLIINIRGQKINLVGFDEPRFGEYKPEIAVPGKDFQGLRIALTHNPDLFGHNLGENFDLLIAGHTHAAESVVGPFSGVSFLKLLGRLGREPLCKSSWFNNFNHHFREFDAPTDRTLAYISPGLTTKFNLPRFNTQKEGFAIFHLYDCPIWRGLQGQ